MDIGVGLETCQSMLLNVSHCRVLSYEHYLGAFLS